MTKWNAKCRFFNEKYACDTLTNEGLKSCEQCKFSSQYSKKILIIKLGALGDVLRTTPILHAIKEKYPESMIYWLTLEEAKELLENNPYIDRLLFYNTESLLRIQQESFDILFSLETTPPATLLANIVKAPEKFGYYFDNSSTSCFNSKAEEYLNTAFLTHVKKQNTKTYQELIFSVCELPYNKQEIIFELTDKEKNLTENFRKDNKLENEKILGINFSSGQRWPSKAWSRDKLREFIKKIEGYKVILLGGPEEEGLLEEVRDELKKENIEVIAKNTKDSILEFAAIISLCDKIIATDSLCLHLATALKKPTIALFFSTPPQEIEDYNLVKKISSPLLEKYFFSNQYSEELANSISIEQILEAIEK